MTFRLLLAFALMIVLWGQPLVAVAIDCQNMRKDYQAICADPVLRHADEAREAMYARVRETLPSDERGAFMSYEDRWLSYRNSCTGDGDEKECLSRAINAHAAELATLQGDGRALVGRLAFRKRQKVDARANIDIHATYVEFATPRSPGETFFNQRVAVAVTRNLPFDREVDPHRTSAWNEWLDVLSVYRSPTFISLRFDGWSCCGVGTAYRLSVNVDLVRATILEPERLFNLRIVKEACRASFGDLADILFPTDASLPDETLLNQQNWSFTHEGAFIELGRLICFLRPRELRRAAKTGVTLPL